MALTKCRWWYGNDSVRDEEPVLHEFSDVILIPSAVAQAAWLPSGVFLADGAVCAEAATSILPTVVHDAHLGARLGEVLAMARDAPEERYLYLGYPTPHYGHFLLSFVSRLWRNGVLQAGDVKILYHGSDTVETLFARDVAAAVFRAIGLTPERFVRFDEVMRIARLYVPAVALGENDFVHRNFAELGHGIGRQVLAGMQLSCTDRPVYVSKAQVTSGVRRLVNEAVMTDVLAAHGVDILYPERLSFAEQIAVYYERDVVIGTIGSAFHTSVFAPPKTIIGIGYTEWYLSNYRLVDRVNGNDAHYYYDPDGVLDEPAEGHWQAASRLADPVKTAHELLRICDRLAARRAGGRNATGWRNHALNRPSDQSSVHPAEPGVIEAGQISTATSGVLTGRYQFSTRHEAGPWWRVDLGRVCRIGQVVLHNRLDAMPERCRDVVISVSDDDVTWRDMFAGEGLTVGNGITGDPLAVDVAVSARFVRVGLRGQDYLHLDQVEVMGPEA